MSVREDRRPTLASWPKRIYGWEELPSRFRPALEAWRDRGLPPGNVTYIPRVHQYADSPEYATAWLGEEVLLLTGRAGREVERLLVRPGEVARLRYTVRLLSCGVNLTLSRDGGREGTEFLYNKTKEDQLLPVLNLLLGNPADYRPNISHPSSEVLEQLRADSFAMYHTAKLCYRFGEPIRDSLWLRGRNPGLAGLRKQKPEYFLGKLDRGLVAIRTDFYGSEAVYLTWTQLRRASLIEAEVPEWGHKKRPALVLEAAFGEDITVPLQPEQLERAGRFASGLPVISGS